MDRSHKPRRAVTLRTKLIASIVGLIVLLSAVIGVTTELFLSRYLVQQLDQRLVGVQEHAPDIVAAGGSTTSIPPPSGSTAPDQRAPSCLINAGGFRQLDGLSICITGTTVTRAVIWSNFVPTTLTATQLAAVRSAALSASASTVSIPGWGEYRVVQVVPRGLSTTGDKITLINGLSLSSVTDTQRRLALVMALVAGGAIILGGLIVFVIVRRSVRPLERVAATARKVATLPLDKGDVDLTIRVPARDTDSRTEIGSVGAAINQMLGHVSGALSARHASETRVRQFVADASHELRTPLAAIRGYAELARRGEHEPGAVAHALRRVESETGRMTTLVEDLLLLARLDSGRPLANEEVDLTMLVVDRVSDARVAGPDHRWQLDLPDEPVTVTGDSARLHQVLANLLANARTHTPPGTVVVTGLRREPGGVVMTVTDNGPGIPAELQPEIFGRFVRGDSSRSRAAGSTGLGLSIVTAVIAAHGGTVTVESRPGRTCARVWLPDNVNLPGAPFDTLPATSGLPSPSAA
ncbi:sensor histidine kinase [Nakamurella panacisegetis]|uniref:sensor histidine kinase n=1 Tax=Nakamurella panacisegetis TaxID=1090615 RepID=UPI000B83ADB2|nr:HAMP domain-containing sensor histidine kinase [Nakamurella panacisegetis]